MRVPLLVLALLVGPAALADPRTWYLPGVAETTGLNDAVFSSTLVISNLGSGATTVRIGLIPYEGKPVPAPVTRSLALDQTLQVEHVLRTLFGLSGDAGTLTLTSDSPLAVSLTTANVADPAGTFGLALLPAEGPTLLRAGETGHAIWVSQTPASRTNVAVALLDPDSSVDILVYGDDGTSLGTTTVQSPTPVSFQASVPSLTNGREVRVGRVELRVTAGRATGYAAVVDNVTNDGIAVQAERVADASHDFLLDGVVRTAGRNGTFFQTDVRVFNASASSLELTLDALGFGGGPRTLTRHAAPYSVLELTDVLGPAGFDLGEGAAGALRLHASTPFLAVGRTSNIDPTGLKPGSFSVFQRALPYPGGLLLPGQRAVVAGIDQTNSIPGFRTNLALLGGPAGATGQLVLRDAAGAVVANAPFSLGTNQWVQQSSTAWFQGAAIPDGSRTEVVPATGSLDAYAARVDNGTGDGVVLPAVAFGASACAQPSILAWTATPTATSSPGAAVTLTLASEHGTSAVVNPGSLPIPLNGSLTVSPQVSTAYTATVFGACPPASAAAVNVEVTRPPCAAPVFSDLHVTPDSIAPGESVTLRVDADGATSALITPGNLEVVPPVTVTLRPTQTTEYLVTLRNDCGTASESAPVRVVSSYGPLLNEIGFNPPPGQPQFVELRVGNAGPPLSTLKLVSSAGEVYPLPSDLSQPAEQGVVLVLFDGQGRVDGTTVHADRQGFLKPDSSVSLVDAEETVLDEIAWDGGPGSAPLTRGGIRGELPAGSAIARIPRSREPGPAGWTIQAPAEATPGAPNRIPGVTIIPSSGSFFGSGAGTVSWYAAPGAARYRVQLSASQDFSSLLLDEVVDVPAVEVTVPAGPHFFRVQAIAPDGSLAVFSPPAVFTGVAFGTTSQNRALLDAGCKRVRNLNLLYQRKDTSLLFLESTKPTGPHAWDRPHPSVPVDGQRMSDPACSGNCFLACAQMINHKYGGKLSQDRMGIQLNRSRMPGPERDFNNGGTKDGGVYVDQTHSPEWSTVLGFALGGASRLLKVSTATPSEKDLLWEKVKEEIDADRPLILATTGHVVVVAGYNEGQSPCIGKRCLILFNPSENIPSPPAGEPCPVNERFFSSIDLVNPDYLILIPAAPQARSDEPEVSTDSDHDGVMDWDEGQRFGTSSSRNDSDFDCLGDKEEIKASVFGKRRGWSQEAAGKATTVTGTARDADGDGRPPELEPPPGEDSDGDGLPDAWEDRNLDGLVQAGESNPNDPGDGARTISGSYTLVLESTFVREGYLRHGRLTYTASFVLHKFNGGKTTTGLVSGTVTENWDGFIGNDCSWNCTSTQPFAIGLTGASSNGGAQYEAAGGTCADFLEPFVKPCGDIHFCGVTEVGSIPRPRTCVTSCGTSFDGVIEGPMHISGTAPIRFLRFEKSSNTADRTFDGTYRAEDVTQKVHLTLKARMTLDAF